jgi:cytochrome c-type biogenesis protein CcmH/NrfG
VHNETAQLILAQLHWIKLLIGVLAVLMLVLTILMIMQQLRFQRWVCPPPAPGFRKFYREASELLRDEKHDEVRELAEKRIAEKPNDYAGYWFSGLSSFMQGDHAAALALFQKALDLQPGMEGQLRPYIERCEAKTAEESANSSG